jgi:carboxymethylenebutenolidase
LRIRPSLGCGAAVVWVAFASTMAAQGRDSTVAPPEENLPQISVVGEDVMYGTGDNGEPLHGYLAYPGEARHGSRPAVIAIHDWPGLDDNMHAMARRLAGEGYTVLAVDLYGGKVAPNADSAQAYMRRVEGNPHGTLMNLKAANAFLRYTEGAHRLATLGWSLGGAWGLREGLFDAKHVHAVVMYYGAPILSRDDLQRLRGPLLGFYGGADESIPADSLRTFKHELDALGKTSTIKIYDGAKHGFANPSGTAYDSTAASDAWQRTTSFLSRYLRGY